MAEQQDVIIIGAGLSGLSAAHFLDRLCPGLSILILEKNSRSGGAIRSFRQEGYLAEWGPHGFLDNTAESLELLADTGLDREVQRAPLGEFARFVCRRGTLVQLPQNPKSLLTTPLLSLPGKLRLLADLWRRPVTEEQTIGQWAAYRFGREVLPLVDAAVTGTFAGDFERLSIDAVMPGVRGLEKRHGSVFRGLIRKKKEAGKKKGLPAMLSFPQGLERLVERLADKREIRLQSGVTAIAAENGRWRVETVDGSYRAASVIVALGVNPSLPLLAPLSAPPVRGIPEAKIANVVLGFGEAAAIPKAFGYLAPEAEKRFTMGAIFSSRMFPGRSPAGQVLLEALVGGRRHPERLTLPDEEIIMRVVDDLRQLLPLPEQPLFSRILRPAMGIPQPEMDQLALLRWRRDLQQDQPGLAVCGFGWDGIGINDMVKAAKAAAGIAAGRSEGSREAEVKPVYF